MQCSEIIDFLWKYEDDRLSPGQRREFDAHLAVCPACVHYLRSYRDTIRLVGESGGVDEAGLTSAAPRELVQAVLAAIGKD